MLFLVRPSGNTPVKIPTACKSVWRVNWHLLLESHIHFMFISTSSQATVVTETSESQALLLGSNFFPQQMLIKKYILVKGSIKKKYIFAAVEEECF